MRIVYLIAVAVTLFVFFQLLLYKNITTVKLKVSSSDLKELSSKEKLEDLDYLYNAIKNNYPYLEVSKRKTGYDWLKHKEDFDKMVLKSKNNIEFYNAVEEILCLLQNAHTNILEPSAYNYYKDAYKGLYNTAWRQILTNKNVEGKYSEWNKIIKNSKKVIPISFKYVEGKYIAYRNLGDEDSFKKHDIPKYSILNRVNDISVDDYILSNMNRLYLTYDFKRKKLMVKDLVLYSKEDKPLKLELKTMDGKILTKELYALDFNWDTRYSANLEKVYETKIIEKDKLAYLKIWSFSYDYVDKDREGIYSFLKSIKDYPYLIIDIRGNGGGSEDYYRKNIVPPLIEKKISAQFYALFRNGDEMKPFLKTRGIFTKPIEKLPKGLNYPEETMRLFSGFIDSTTEIRPGKSVGFNGKIYLLVDDYVYSSAEAFAAFCKATGFATLVGTTTGGDGIGMDPGLLALPNSGLIIRFPIEMGLNPDGTSNEEYHTQPDIYVEKTIEYFIKYDEYRQNNNEIINPYDELLNNVINMIS
ncbi:Peptidase family S41 [Caloramator mitchellensis]|uniref:Peptidase family S41 n=1 Tax=Caloramator mitchellensis TaxID=908809 RepID=A0A0R3JVT4_CALMK|nr:Peptidase family S41 [Caloramator mitchellensis]